MIFVCLRLVLRHVRFHDVVYNSYLYKPPKIIAHHFLSEFEAGASYHPGCLTIDQSTNHKP